MMPARSKIAFRVLKYLLQSLIHCNKGFRFHHTDLDPVVVRLILQHYLVERYNLNKLPQTLDTSSNS